MAAKENAGHRQRLRDRFLAAEENSRPEEALLELLLTYAIPYKDIQPLAKKLIEEFGSLSAVLQAPDEKLCSFDGLKANSAVLIKLVDYIRSHHPLGKSKHNGACEPQGKQLTLFDSPTIPKSPPPDSPRELEPGRHKKLLPRRGTLMFANAVLKETIALLPNFPDTDSLEEIRSHLRERLHYSAEQTRKRYASYIVRRMFPTGYADPALRKFAKAFEQNQVLRDVCFYRFLKSEPLEIQVIEELVLPNIGNGRLNRAKLKNYLSEQFPTAKSVKDCAQAIVDALGACDIAKVDKTKIAFGYREILLPSFAFVLYSEFPEPGMYDISKVETNRAILAMLWNPARILLSLYELRNLGLISKISEIDNIRQFTTKWSLDQVVDRLVAKGKEA